MLRTFRILRRDTMGLLTNVGGLSLGLAASILLTTFILFELSYDRHFSHTDRIHRMNTIWIDGENRMEMPINVREAYSEIPGNVAGIEAVVQLYRGFEKEIEYRENRHKGMHLLYADPAFFQLFNLPFLEGSPINALSGPGKVILTEECARKVFGEEEALNASFSMENEVYTVSAVIGDIPPNTHFDFDMLMPMQAVKDLHFLQGLEFFTYYLLEPGVDVPLVCEAIAGENTRILYDKFSGFGSADFDSRLSPLRDLHLRSGISWDLSTPGNMQTIYIMLVITLAIMGLALSNFINLYILNGARRSGEIGIRKVSGAGRPQLIRQFYRETTLTVSLAFIAGAVLAILLLPPFANLMQREAFSQVGDTPALYLVLALVFLLTILLSGLYPALLLSRAAPIPLIRGLVNPAGDKRLLLRAVNVLQVCISVCLFTILLGINAQVHFLKNRSVGYEPDNIVLIHNLNEKLTGNFPALKEHLLAIPGIIQVGATGHTIGAGYSGQGIYMHGEDPEKARSIAEYRIQPGLCNLYRFSLVSGRFLEEERSTERKRVILNETAVAMLGYNPEGIVGESIILHDEPLEIAGVVEDFNFESAAVEVAPLVLTAYSETIRSLVTRIDPGMDPQTVIEAIKKAMQVFDPDYVIINRFATDICDNYYLKEERLQKILLFGSLMAIVIVLLGIYALVSHNLLSRTKEIGIRKVMGGTTSQMMSMMYTSSLRWTLLGSVLAIPLAWLYLDRWLEEYAVRTHLHWGLFALAILIVILFQGLITLGRTRQTALRNPVEALRYE